ncbi:MAG: NAD(P)H-dependent oxidoreductase subunit E, partial [bacterium]|nr:NAD(P)H-dependent oxidoreductase subunit E [bacterium]
MARNASFDFPPPRLSALAARQKKDGVLSKDTVAALAREMDVPAHELYGLASFFPQFRLAPTDGPEIQICQDLSCQLAGSGKLLEAA